MLASAKSCAVVGLDGIVVDVEVDISPGLPRFDVVGLPDAAVQEARARVRAAVRNSGCEFPLRRITANLAPADVRKAGSTAIQGRPELLASAKSCAVVGLDGIVVDVEVDISPGLPRFDVVGLPDAAVQEARARVRAAVRNSGCEFPLRRITANLAPADVRKAGATTCRLPSPSCKVQVSWRLFTVTRCSWGSYHSTAICCTRTAYSLWSH